MIVPPLEVAGDGPFAGIPAPEMMKILFEAYLLFPLRQMRACGEDAQWGVDSDEPPYAAAVWIEGEDVPFGVVEVVPGEAGIQLLGCVYGMEKWDAMKARGHR